MNTFVIVGIIALVFGLALVMFRTRLDAVNSRATNAMQAEPKNAMQTQGGYYKPFILGVGILIFIVGVVLIVVGLA